jgi:hypothetical protein
MENVTGRGMAAGRILITIMSKRIIYDSAPLLTVIIWAVRLLVRVMST